MKFEFLILVILFPVLCIGLVTWLTYAHIVTGVWAVVIWVGAMLAAIIFDSWISARYTLKRLADQRAKERKDHHE